MKSLTSHYLCVAAAQSSTPAIIVVVYWWHQLLLRRTPCNASMLRAALFPLALVALHQLLLFAVRKEYTVHESGGIVVTGASTGIGRHAALALAKKGYVVYAGCRKVTACTA